MLLLRFWNYLRGYVIIVVEGYFLEKFINICTHRQIFLWDLKRNNNGTMTLKISIKGFMLLRPVAKKSSCRVRILKKKGLPFTVHRYKGRKTFAVGALLFVGLLMVLSSFVWKIEVSGNKKVDTSLLMERLAAHGIKTGVLKYGIDTDYIANGMMMDMKELSWIGITVKGTKVKVEVAESIKPPELIPLDSPCNIVARRDGVIKSVVTKEGEPMVKAGDTVTKGKVLITGRIESKYKDVQPRMVHAMGEVTARTWYEASSPVEMTAVEKTRTGESKDSYALVLFKKQFGLFSPKINYEDYDKIEIVKSLSIGKDFFLPFELHIERYYENTVNEREMDLESAKQLAADKAYEKAAQDIPEGAEIVNKKLSFSQNSNNELVANMVIECVEDIGSTEEIGGQ